MASKNSRKAAKRRAAGRKASRKPTGLILGMVAAAAAIAVWTTAAPGEAPWTKTKTETKAETSPTSTVSTQAPVVQAARAQLPAASHDQAPRRGPVAILASTDLPPLPMVQFPAPRPPEVIRSVYAFAANHPEVLSYVPCFCGCENFGHGDNHDCFVADRDAEGRVTWEAHGMG